MSIQTIMKPADNAAKRCLCTLILGGDPAGTGPATARRR
jgi:hypothetical protein